MKIRSLKAAATATMADTEYNPRLLAVIHIGVTLTLSLVLLVLNYAITRNINAATGLSQLGNRAILATVQSVLSIAVLVATPFWDIGFFYVVLRMARTGHGRPADLLEGFRRLGPVVRLYLLQSVIYVGLFLICSHLASIIFSFTPFVDPFIEIMEPILEQAAVTGQLVVDEAIVAQLLPAMIPMYVILGILLAAVGIPIFYRFRMAQFAIMDDAPGAFAALRTSSRILRGKRFFLFRLDLSFWWFYGMQALILLISNADVILAFLKITLPVPDAVLFFAPFVIRMVLQLVLAWCSVSYVQTTYAHCYETLKAAGASTPKPQPLPKAFPWEQQ